jgi:hypothetical protein
MTLIRKDEQLDIELDVMRLILDIAERDDQNSSVLYVSFKGADGRCMFGGTSETLTRSVVLAIKENKELGAIIFKALSEYASEIGNKEFKAIFS